MIRGPGAGDEFERHLPAHTGARRLHDIARGSAKKLSLEDRGVAEVRFDHVAREGESGRWVHRHAPAMRGGLCLTDISPTFHPQSSFPGVISVVPSELEFPEFIDK